MSFYPLTVNTNWPGPSWSHQLRLLNQTYECLSSAQQFVHSCCNKGFLILWCISEYIRNVVSFFWILDLKILLFHLSDAKMCRPLILLQISSSELKHWTSVSRYVRPSDICVTVTRPLLTLVPGRSAPQKCDLACDPIFWQCPLYICLMSWCWQMGFYILGLSALQLWH